MMDLIKRFCDLFIEQIRGIYFSDLLMIILISALICFVPGYILHIKKGVSIKSIIHVFLLVEYAGVILALTIFRREAGSKVGIINTYLNFGVYKTYVYSWSQVMYSLMNFLLFVPWGILLSLFRTRQPLIRNIFMTTLTGFLTSFFIETLQHITRTGYFEITDIVTNVAGTFCGACLVAALMLISRRKARNEIF